MTNTPNLTTKTKRKSFPKSPNITVLVSEDTIEASIRRNSSHCMIADGLKVAVPNARKVSVDLQTIRWTDPDRQLRYIYLTPRIGQVGIINFDQGLKPEPFQFNLAKGRVVRANKKSRKIRQKWAEWEPVKRAIRSLYPDTAMTDVAKTLSKESGIDENKVYHALTKPDKPTAEVDAALREWVKKQPGVVIAKPERVPKDSRAAASLPSRAILRRTAGRSAPELIGGKEPPIGNLAKRRQFGLKSLVL